MQVEGPHPQIPVNSSDLYISHITSQGRTDIDFRPRVWHNQAYRICQLNRSCGRLESIRRSGRWYDFCHAALEFHTTSQRVQSPRFGLLPRVESGHGIRDGGDEACCEQDEGEQARK